MAVDLDGAVQVVNQAAEARLGRSRMRLVGQSLAPLEPSGETLLALAREAQVRRAGVQGASSLGPVEAQPWWYEGRMAGALLSLPPSSPPVSEIDLAALAAGLAHEVRNPLTALRGAAELLAAEPAVAGAADRGPSECVALVLRMSARIEALLGRMMQLCRPVRLSWAPVPASELVHELAGQARAVAAALGVPVRVQERFDPALPPLWGDAEVLQAALGNLVRNAVEAMQPRGGLLELELTLDPALRKQRVAGADRPLVRIVVRDEGAGLGEARDRLFTPFVTTKGGGTGLGLLLARQAVEAHGGRLSLNDRSTGTGAEAQVLLPLGGDDGRR